MQKPVQILLIEDDFEDAELFEDVLRENAPAYQLKVIPDGGAFFEYMTDNKALPDIIVLDFNLPKIHGRDILKGIKNNDLYKNIKIVILTTSSAIEDKEYSRKMGALDFFVKPNTIKELHSIVGSILQYCVDNSPH